LPEVSVAFQQIGMSLLLGLLVGLQRERTETGMPGVRTFPMITLLGAVCAMLGREFGTWVIPAGLLAVVATMSFPSLVRIRSAEPDPGTTTHIAALLMYAVGALLVVAPMSLAIVVAGCVAVLLQFKLELHSIAHKLGDGDLRAIMQFVLITCIILPVLPNQTYGPLGAFNPYETWLMVVLIVGMSLGGYIAYRFLGRGAGILLGGTLGGAISSTATTVSYARQARTGPISTQAATIVILIASTVVFVRVLVEIAVVAPRFLATAAFPVMILMLLTLIPALVSWLRVRKTPAEMPEQGNPTQLKSAIFFAGMYAAVVLALAAAREYLGNEALYAVAVLSGLTDMDAITLSTARIAQNNPQFAVEDGWRLIVIGAMANLVFKAGIAGLLGRWRLLAHVAVLFSIPLAGGAMLLIFWR